MCGEENKTLRATELLFDLNFFKSFFCNEIFLSFQLYWFVKGLIFYIFVDFSQHFYGVMQLLQHAENNYRYHYLLDLLLLFLSVYDPLLFKLILLHL